MTSKPLRKVVPEQPMDVEHLFKGRSVGIISAGRDNLPEAENNKRHKALHSSLKKLGHIVIPAEGGYVHNYGTPQARPTHEKSFIVAHKNPGSDGGQVYRDLIHLGKHYGQDSILHKPHDSDIASFHGTNDSAKPGIGKYDTVGKLKMDKAGEFYTRLANGRTFVFE